jgi:hypothetical protein
MTMDWMTTYLAINFCEDGIELAIDKAAQQIGPVRNSWPGDDDGN